jgi:hypothetical protein
MSCACNPHLVCRKLLPQTATYLEKKKKEVQELMNGEQNYSDVSIFSSTSTVYA